jgi:hypothetical protein
MRRHAASSEGDRPQLAHEGEGTTRSATTTGSGVVTPSRKQLEISAVKSDPRTTGEWLCIAERHEQGGVLRDELIVQVEVLSEVGRPDDLRSHLEGRLQSDLGVKVAIELVDEGSLAAAANLGREGKARRLVDWRRK